MMDELELLKKDWQKKEEQLPKLSYDEIHHMIWKKSSSLVKWILIISILEFTLPQFLYLMPSMKEAANITKEMGIHSLIIGLTIFQYSIILHFIYQFYRRYKEISVLDNANNLMKKIKRTRKTVKQYIIFSLSMVLFTFAIFIVGIYLNEDFTNNFIRLNNEAKNISPEKLKTTLIWILAITGVLMTLIMGGIYFLLYGLLLRRLNINHNELKRLEI